MYENKDSFTINFFYLFPKYFFMACGIGQIRIRNNKKIINGLLQGINHFRWNDVVWRLSVPL